MAGGSPEHARIAANIAATLAAQLAGRRCAVFSSDLRVRVMPTGLATYPDITVVCGHLEFDPDDPKKHTVTNPTLIIEILSPSTEEYDRGEKLHHYQQIPALRAVVLVATDVQRIDVWRRTERGWALDSNALDAAQLEAIGCQLTLAAVYADPLST